MDNPLDGKRYGLLNKLFKFSQLHELNLFNTTLPFHAEFKPMQEKNSAPFICSFITRNLQEVHGSYFNNEEFYRRTDVYHFQRNQKASGQPSIHGCQLLRSIRQEYIKNGTPHFQILKDRNDTIPNKSK
jgi:hypothetical protein